MILDYNFFKYLHVWIKKNIVKLEKDYMILKKITKINRSLKNKLLKELNSISINLKFI